MENVNITHHPDDLTIKQQIDNLYQKLAESAMTFVYKPDEIEKIRQNIFELQNKCLHEYVDGKCIYCRRVQGNVDEKKRYL